MPEEFFDIVDDEGRIIGQAARSDCHGNPVLVHRAVHVLLFNGKGDLLLQKRSLDKDIQPGKWDTSVGGHLDLGEDFLTAAKREMTEELGVSGIPLTFLYSSTIRNHVESENIETYLAVSDKEVSPDPLEVTEVRFWGYQDIEESLGQDVFTPNFEEEWRMFKDFSRRYHSAGSRSTGLCAGDSMPDILQCLYLD